MLLAENYTAALIEHGDDQWYIVGLSSDIQRLSDAGAVARAWDIKLDNGHRPYPVLKKRLTFDITDQASAQCRQPLAAELSRRFQLRFAGELYDVTKTYLLRPTPAFWAELGIAFADEQGQVAGLNLNEYYAVYQGCILPVISGIKFIRLDPQAFSKTIFPALS